MENSTRDLISTTTKGIKELEVGGGMMVGREKGQKSCQAVFKQARKEHSSPLGLPPSPVHKVTGWGGGQHPGEKLSKSPA